MVMMLELDDVVDSNEQYTQLARWRSHELSDVSLSPVLCKLEGPQQILAYDPNPQQPSSAYTQVRWLDDPSIK